LTCISSARFYHAIKLYYSSLTQFYFLHKVMENKIASKRLFLVVVFLFLQQLRNLNKLIQLLGFKGRVQCFSMQVEMNNCFLLNPEKNLAQIRLVVF